MQILKKEDRTFDIQNMTAEARWSYYISSYIMRDPTEGVPRDIQWPFLRRNTHRDLDTEEDYGQNYLPQWNEDGLTVRVGWNYRIVYDADTTDWWVHDEKVRRRGLKGAASLGRERNRIFEEKLVRNPSWAHGMSADQVAHSTRQYLRLVTGGTAPPGGATSDVQEASRSRSDELMGGV